MNPTSQTLLEQMRITDLEIEARKAAFLLTEADASVLSSIRCLVEARVDELVERFYAQQTAIPEVALKIGDADTLRRLKSAQRRYIIDLFQGSFDLEYVNNRLRIGLVHKRIGVEPRLYLAAIHSLKLMLIDTLRAMTLEPGCCERSIAALEKAFMFDMTLVFETYVKSLLTEVQTSRDKVEEYAHELEDRTRQLEDLSRLDPLTGLLNRRYLDDIVTQVLRAAQRRSEPVAVIYIDVNDFKRINDSEGHLYGDAILRSLGEIIRMISRMEDCCFRYGGDEFCVVLPDCGEPEASEIYVNRLHEEVARRLKGVSLSIGCVQTGPEQYVSTEEIIRMADERMYGMKQSARGVALLAPG